MQHPLGKEKGSSRLTFDSSITPPSFFQRARGPGRRRSQLTRHGTPRPAGEPGLPRAV